MRAEDFVKHGVRGHLLHEIKQHYYGPEPIRVYDIAHDDYFGVMYPDKSCQAQLKVWHRTAQRAYEKLKEEGKLFMPTQDGLPAVIRPRVLIETRGQAQIRRR